MSAFVLVSTLVDGLASGTTVFVLAASLVVQAVMLLYAGHRALTLWRCRRPLPSPPRLDPRVDPPWVTVQLPVYDERLVVERLIAAAARLRHPADRLEIQVLDDSDDETVALARHAVERHRADGVPIQWIHRGRREGFKAGALAHGLACARGEIVVVFDADFVPDPDFLERVVPHFADPRVGMVQARWGHLNRDGSALTRAQAALLDAHFHLEHRGRMASGLFFNFNGTAGAWRRECIESAGGWQHDTLTEDLDLSYRAQLAGWRFVFDPSIEARAELPGDFAALRSQQRRWVCGSIQTARKLLPRILGSELPWRIKLEALIHLTANFGYPLALALALLTLTLLAIPLPGSKSLAIAEGLAILVSVAPIMIGLIVAQRLAGRSWLATVRDGLTAFVLAAGLTVHNSRAVLEGLGRRLGEWERTPKSGDGFARTELAPYPRRKEKGGLVELGLALAFVAGLAAGALRGRPGEMPFMALFALGLAWVGSGASWPRRRRIAEEVKTRTPPRGTGRRRASRTPQSRAIFGERLPLSALRVSTTDFE